MKTAGIIVNPASGKDIRRLVFYATTMNNREKVNIVKRIILAAQILGVEKFIFMPDSYGFGFLVEEELKLDGRLNAECEILDFEITDTQKDTEKAAVMMEGRNVGCIIVVGGDGTSRAVAKSIDKTPIVPISTGTNNVYPVRTEGTVVGTAVGLFLNMKNAIRRCCVRDKRIEVLKNEKFIDMALIDAVISDDLWVGSRAIWDSEKIQVIYVTRCHPGNIGFSAIPGAVKIVGAGDKGGICTKLAHGDISGCMKVLTTIAPGTVEKIAVKEIIYMEPDKIFEYSVKFGCMVALDGEREFRCCEGDRLEFRITEKGPLRIDIERTLEIGVRSGMLQVI